MKKSEKKEGGRGDLKKKGTRLQERIQKRAEKIYMIRGKSVFLY